MATTVKKWMGSPIENCEVCGWKVGSVFYDAYTPSTRWAILCHRCFEGLGGKLGLGLGQKYNTRTLEKIGG